MTARNLALDATTHDIVVARGQLQLVSDAAAVAQAVECALLTFLGEWFLDSTPPQVGVPYYQAVLIKNPDANVLRAVFTGVITGVAGVAAIQSLQLNYDHTTRKLAVVWSVTTDLGQIVSGTTGL